jgi:proteic killer suppression protein
LKVFYEDKKIEKLCTDERQMQKLRADVSRKLKLRIKALETAETVGELPTIDPLGYWHQLTANLDGLWAGKLSANNRILIRPEDSDEPWLSVTVTVTEIADYH